MLGRELHITWQDPPSRAPNRRALMQVYYPEGTNMRSVEKFPNVAELDVERMRKRLWQKHQFKSVDKVREFCSRNEDFSEGDSENASEASSET